MCAGGADDPHESAYVFYAHAGWGWAEAAQECVVGLGEVQGVQEGSMVPSFPLAF